MDMLISLAAIDQPTPWEVNPLSLLTLVVTLFTLLGIVWRGTRKFGAAVIEMRDRMASWDLSAEVHPGLQRALAQQAGSVEKLTENVLSLTESVEVLTGEVGQIKRAVHGVQRTMDDTPPDGTMRPPS